MVICRNENLIKRAAEVALNNLAARGEAAGEVGSKTKFPGIPRNTALWACFMPFNVLYDLFDIIQFAFVCLFVLHISDLFPLL